ncbi:M15 family metallopeptidase [Nocardiopsis sp. ATB16-24]|uniref:M15 family metallopeptidase n=1 Tax=Nocardiopsis sp. ATB16-24 TaxID=3019555 RepID=UPI0025528A7A|nr:M15 family metallopeptidase [Nocardiopsis sp. ATB16-24]
MLPVGLAALLVLSTATSGGADDSGPVERSSPGDVRVELAILRAGMETLRQEASAKIERYEAERERLTELTERRRSSEERAEEADERGRTARLAAARQASTAYKGGDLGMLSAWTGGPSEVLERGAYLSLLGEHREADVDRGEAARVATDTLAEIAEAAEHEQSEAVEAAAAAREEAVRAVTEREEALEELLEEQTRLEAELAKEVDPRAAERRRERALRGARAAIAPTEDDDVPGEGDDTKASTTDVAVDGGPGSGCTGADVTVHANGHIPETLLCPLPQPGERLRADAAAAFIELDGAYRKAFGRPMCVADSYRPYHEQVRLFREMVPGMAADPGTSRHGLGLAVDLCGGVNRSGTPEHEWMLANAPRYGWDNPVWARGGYEPWHWEFDAS